MRTRGLLLAGLLACQRTPEPDLPPPHPRIPQPIQQLEVIDEPPPPTPTQPPEVALPEPATEFYDFSDGRPHTGDFLIWRRPDDFESDVTYWLSIQATSTELVGERDGLWIASRDVIWHWLPTQTDLPVCAPLACEDEVPRCKPMARTGAGLVDEAQWQDLLATRTVPVGPRLPSVAATGLGARSLHEAWLPLTVLNGTLLLRVETHWRLCDGGGGGRVQVKRIEPPLPVLRPLYGGDGELPPELRLLGQQGRPLWGGLQQNVDADGRWRVHDEWLVPLPAEVSEIAEESQYTPARSPAERLPAGLAADARGAPSLRGSELIKGATEADAPRWGWSRLYATGERRAQLRRRFVGEEPAPR